MDRIGFKRVGPGWVMGQPDPFAALTSCFTYSLKCHEHFLNQSAYTSQLHKHKSNTSRHYSAPHLLHIP